MYTSELCVHFAFCSHLISPSVFPVIFYFINSQTEMLKTLKKMKSCSSVEKSINTSVFILNIIHISQLNIKHFFLSILFSLSVSLSCLMVFQSCVTIETQRIGMLDFFSPFHFILLSSLALDPPCFPSFLSFFLFITSSPMTVPVGDSRNGSNTDLLILLLHSHCKTLILA